MAKFVFILKGKNKGALTTDLLGEHFGHLKSLKHNGMLFLCGPFGDNDGVMQVIEANEENNYLLDREQTKHN